MGEDKMSKTGLFRGVGENSDSIYKVGEYSTIDVSHPKHRKSVLNRHKKNRAAYALAIMVVMFFVGLRGFDLTMVGLITYALVPYLGRRVTYLGYDIKSGVTKGKHDNFYLGLGGVYNKKGVEYSDYYLLKMKEDKAYNMLKLTGQKYNSAEDDIGISEEGKYVRKDEELDTNIFKTGVEYNLNYLKTLYITEDNELMFEYEAIDIEESVNKGYLVSDTKRKGLRRMEEVSDRIVQQAMVMYIKNEVLTDKQILSLMETYEIICYHKSSKLVQESYQKMLDKKTELGSKHIIRLQENEQQLIEELDKLKEEGKTHLEQNKAIIESIKTAS